MTRQRTSGRYKNSESQPSGDEVLIDGAAVVAIATIITPQSRRQANEVAAPRISSKPHTNSTVETKKTLNSRKGTRAARKVSRICSRRCLTKSLPPPERKNAQPTATRASKAAIQAQLRNSMRMLSGRNKNDFIHVKVGG